MVTMINLHKYYAVRTYVSFMSKKLEHVNPVQKWLGARLRKHKNEKKSTILSSGRKIRNKSWLSDK